MKHKVLLVDDDINLLEGLTRLLHKEPYQIVTAQSGQEALGVLKDTSVDVVVSDQEMPGMQGTQFLWQVRKSYPGAILFMLTGKATLRMATLAVNEIGISRFFMKPCNAVDLALTLRQALQHRDLMTLTSRLLKRAEQQDALLSRLEKQSPGITQVETQGPAAMLREEGDPVDGDALLEKLRAWLEKEGNDNMSGERAGVQGE